MVPQSNDFYTNVVDGQTPQDCLLIFENNMAFEPLFVGSQGAFEASGVSFTEDLFHNEYLEFGSSTCRTMSVNLMNPDKMLKGFVFGKCVAYISVWILRTPGAFEATDYASYTYTIDSDGLLYGDDISTPIDPDHTYKCFVRYKDGYVWALGEETICLCNQGTGSVSAAPDHIAGLVKLGMSGTFLFNSAMTEYDHYDPTDGYIHTYELCPMGVYNVARPERVSLPVISISDAYDYMKELDADASLWVSTFITANPTFTLGQFYTALCTAVGIGYDSSTFKNSTEQFSWTNLSSSSYSFRDYLYYIAEQAFCFARTGRGSRKIGLEDVPQTGDTEQHTYTLGTDVEVGSMDVLDITTLPVTDIKIKYLSGYVFNKNLQLGTKNIYSIMGNPFFKYDANDDGYYTGLYQYAPMYFSVPRCNPALEAGDLVKVTNNVDETYIAPISSVTVRWAGFASASYECEGHELIPTDNVDDTNAYNSYINSFAPQDYDMTSIYGDGGVWQVMKMANGFAVATSTQYINLPTSGWTTWGNCRYVKVLPIHHHIPFDAVYSEQAVAHCDNRNGATTYSVWLASSQKNSQLSPSDDPNEFTHGYLIVRPNAISNVGTVAIDYMIVGMLTNLP